MANKTTIHYTLLVLCVMAFTQSGCVSIPIVHPDGPGDVIVATDSTGVVFNQQGKNLWVKEGVPPEWFTVDGENWHLTNLYWHAGNAIRLKNSNP